MYKTKNILAFLLPISILMSCSSNSLVKGFSIGMGEADMKSNINKQLSNRELTNTGKKDSTSLIYKWDLLDTTIYSTVHFNNDGVPTGKLRIIVIELNDSSVSKVLSEPNNIVRSQILDGEMIWSFGNKSGGTNISYSTCPAEKYALVLKHLQSSFGKEDSITYKINKNTTYESDPLEQNTNILRPISRKSRMIDDTIYTLHNFHDDNSIIVLRREKILPKSTLIPYFHTNEAIVYQISKTYEKEIKLVVDEIKKKLKPSDIVTIEMSYNFKGKDLSSDFDLQVTADIGGDTHQRKTSIESRDIVSMKGRIIISDVYGEILHTLDNIEFYTKNSLPSTKPGLEYAIGSGMNYVETRTYSFGINTNHRTTPIKFKEAVRNESRLKIEFVPDALIFEDGVILK